MRIADGVGQDIMAKTDTSFAGDQVASGEDNTVAGWDLEWSRCE